MSRLHMGTFSVASHEGRPNPGPAVFTYVFCQAKIPTFIMKIPHCHQGNFPTFSEVIRMRSSQPHPAA